MSRKKLLVTGSGGFLFSNFIRFVLKNSSEYEIVSVDNCSSTGSMNTIYSNKNHRLHIGDVADSNFINTIFEIEKPDFVIHGAAHSFVEGSIKDSDDLIKSNIIGTQVIVNNCVKHKVQKLIYTSTDEVYGDLKSENDKSWSEESPISPRNQYSASKAAGELLVKATAQMYDLNYNIVRLSNNYGPRQSRRSFIPTIVGNILDEKKVPIYGEGKELREWIFVQDTVSAILKVLEAGKDNEIYNVSSKQEFSNIEVFNLVSNVLKERHNISKTFELLSFIPNKSRYDFRQSVDCSKISKLGWSPEWKFKEGIVHTIDWYVNNKWFLK